MFMLRALDLAARGQGRVEPNPKVGCVIVRDGQIVGEGWHEKFGGPHAEVAALRSAGSQTRGATLYVTLEPCCHYGKTPPCTQAVIAAGVSRVVAAMLDPFSQVAGKGLAELSSAGIQTQVGVLEREARTLLAPYLKLVNLGRPWIIAKWAMTLDGKISSHAGDSRWISGESSRRIVHELRGRVDGILVGRSTALADDPMLTARPAGPRTALRIVVDSHASLPLTSQLVRTAREIPVLLAVSSDAPSDKCQQLRAAGVEVRLCQGVSWADRLDDLLVELGRRRLTNVLVEGGGVLLGSLFDADQIDEAHIFIAPKLIGGEHAVPPLAGRGRDAISQAAQLYDAQIARSGDDLYIHGRLHRPG